MVKIDSSVLEMGPYTVTHSVTYYGIPGKDERDAVFNLKYVLSHRFNSDNVIIDDIFDVVRTPLFKKNGLIDKIFGEKICDTPSIIQSYDITTKITIKRCDYKEKDLPFERIFYRIHVCGGLIHSSSSIINCKPFEV